MPNWLNYKGLLVPNAAPNDTAGLNLKNDLMTLADNVGLSATTAAIPVVDTGNPTENGTSLSAAYTAAADLSPGGNPLTSANRACVLIFPGTYEFISEFEIAHEYVDLIGIGDPVNIVLTNSGSQPNGFHKTANDVTLANLTLDSSSVSSAILCQDTSGASGSPANERFENIRFTGTASSTAQSSGTWQGNYNGCLDLTSVGELFTGSITGGTFTNCASPQYGFGSSEISGGTFINCNGGQYGFGGNGGSLISGGTFLGCTDGGDGSSFGYGGSITGGDFVNCSAGFSGWFAAITGGTFLGCMAGGSSFAGSIDGATFVGCVAGDGSFGGFGIGATAAPTFQGCSGGASGFAGGATIASGNFIACTASGGFGSEITGGVFQNCTDSGAGFAGVDGTISGGTFQNCSGGDQSFSGDTGEITGGNFQYCSGGNLSFAGSGGSITNGTFDFCEAPDTSSFAGGTGGGGTLNSCLIGGYHVSSDTTALVAGGSATTTSPSLVNVTGLSLALGVGTYEFDAHLSIASSSSAGNKYGIDFSGTASAIEAQAMGTLTASAMQGVRISALNTPTVAFNTIAADGMLLIKGMIVVTAAGNLTVQHAKVTSGTATVYENSALNIRMVI